MTYFMFILFLLAAIMTTYAGSIQENELTKYIFFFASTLWWLCVGLTLYKIATGA